MKTDIWLGTMAAIAGISLFAATGVLTAASAQEGQRIRIRMGDQTVTATLNDSEAARDLVAMLPLSIRMRDHLGREKTGRLPGPLSERTKGSPTYESGDLGYWRPGGNFVIFYRHDGLTIPSPGIVRLGRLVSGTEIFNVPGAIEVIRRAEELCEPRTPWRGRRGPGEGKSNLVARDDHTERHAHG